MRTASLVSVPLLVALATTPAAAQISADIHIGPIRIGHAPVHADAYYGPSIVVVPYSARNYGQWKRTARYWRPITLYLYGGRYYQRSFRNARPVVVYRYRDSYFTAPRDRDWDRYRSRYAQEYWRNDRRDDRRDDRFDRRDDRRDTRRDVIRDNRRGRGAVAAPGRTTGRGAVVAPGRATNRGAARTPNRARRRNG